MRKLSQSVLLAVLLLLFTCNGFGQALNTLYTNQTLITIDPDMVSGNAPITNFPILLDLSANGVLQGVVQADGFDIVFSELVDSDVSVRYKHYLENYDDATGALIIWVQIPSVDNAADTEFYMHYDGVATIGADQSNGEVWTDAGFIGAWQLSETPGAGAVVDATGISANGTTNGDVAAVASVVGQGYSFDGAGDYVSIPGGNVEPAGSFTISCWFQTSGTQNPYAKMFSKGRTGSPYASYTLEMRPQNPGNNAHDDEVGFQTGRVGNTSVLTDTNNEPAQVDPGGWNYFVGTLEDLGGSYEQSIYLNGDLITQSTDAPDVDYYTGDVEYPYSLIIGGIFSNFLDNEFTGIIDELRIASGVRSIDYIKTELRNTACVSNFITIAAIGLNCTDPVLPIELKNFSAELFDDGAKLKWTTSSEKNNDFFTLERSENGTDFIEVAEIPGAGTSNTVHDYEYLDVHSIAGSVYYKLKQTDYDGTFEYSDIVSINNDWQTTPKISIYPNPSSPDANEITVSFAGYTGPSVRVELFSLGGKRISSSLYEAESKSLFTQNIEISSLPAGTYIISIKTDTHLQSELLQIR